MTNVGEWCQVSYKSFAVYRFISIVFPFHAGPLRSIVVAVPPRAFSSNKLKMRVEETVLNMRVEVGVEFVSIRVFLGQSVVSAFSRRWSSSRQPVIAMPSTMSTAPGVVIMFGGKQSLGRAALQGLY